MHGITIISSRTNVIKRNRFRGVELNIDRSRIVVNDDGTYIGPIARLQHIILVYLEMTRT